MSHYVFSTEIAEKIGLVEAILLSQIKFCIDTHKANNENFHKGRYWTYSSTKEFSDFFKYLSDRQISRALKSLVDDGWLIKDNFNTDKFNQTSWYSLSDKFINEFEA